MADQYQQSSRESRLQGTQKMLTSTYRLPKPFHTYPPKLQSPTHVFVYGHPSLTSLGYAGSPFDDGGAPALCNPLTDVWLRGHAMSPCMHPETRVLLLLHPNPSSHQPAFCMGWRGHPTRARWGEIRGGPALGAHYCGAIVVDCLCFFARLPSQRCSSWSLYIYNTRKIFLLYERILSMKYFIWRYFNETHSTTN